MEEVEAYNYLNVFRETVSTSGRWQAGSRYTGRNHKGLIEEKLLALKLQVERWFLLSTQRGTATVSTNYRHTYGYGAFGFISTNAVAYAGSLSESALFEYFEDVFAKGSNMRRHYAGSTQIREINSIVREHSGFQVDNLTDEYGVSLQRLRTDFGMVDLVWDPVLDSKFVNYGFTFDAKPKQTKMRYMANDEVGSRKFRMNYDVHTPGQDGKSDELMMDVGFQLTNEETAGYLYKST